MAFASSALAGWEEGSSRAPFEVSDHDLRQAFLQGAVGPDMGFLPGSGDFRFASELAHYCQPADLVRSMAARARTPAEMAYTWGWLTHVLIDVDLHPVIGRACGEILLGDRSVRMNAMDSATTHVSLEVGVDIALLESEPALPAISPRAGLLPKDMAFVGDAYAATYGIRFRPQEFIGGHRRSAWLNRIWPALLRAVGDRASVVERMVAAAGRGVLRGSTPVGATLRPISPPQWVMERFRGAIAAFPEQLAAIGSAGIEELDNRNLETGVSGGTDPEHTPAVQVRARLDRMRDEQSGAPTPNEVES